MLEALKDKEVPCHALVCDSGLLDMYVYNTLKETCKGTTETIFYVRSKGDVDEMVDLSYVMPFQADTWLFIIEFDKVKRSKRKILDLIKQKPVSSRYLIKFSKYVDFKEFVDTLGSSIINPMYMKSINLTDTRYLFRNYRAMLGKDLMDFIYNSYRSEVEKLFQLRNYLDGGTLVKSRKDITSLIGLSTGSIQHLVIQLLGTPPKNERSQATVIKNRLRVLSELSKVYPPRTLRNIMLGTVKDILDIKTLYLNGILYKSLDNHSIPSQGYDSKRLLRYRFQYGKIIELDFSRIMGLYLQLSNSSLWNTELDVMNFIYVYYRNLGFSDG